METWDDFRFFLAVVREGTLAKAGTLLGVNQSTVHRRIGVLEGQLGTRLFERRGRGYVLTAAGEHLVGFATRIENEVLAVGREVAGRDRKLEGSVRFTTTDTLAMRLLGPHLAGFRELYPGVRLDLLVENRFMTLGRGEAEVALRPGKRPTERNVVARRLCAIAGALYASNSYIEQCGRPRQRPDIAEHRIVGVVEPLSHLTYARLICELAPEVEAVVRCSSLLAQTLAVENGMGIAALPCFLLDRSPGVVRLFTPEKELETSLWMVLHGDLRRTARVRAFVDFLQQRLEGERALLEGRV